MATTVTTVTKTASVVKTTKGSEKKWTEILALNRRHDMQLPIEIARYNHQSKRAYHSYERQKNQTERNRAHRHETWHHDDFLFRTRLLQQLKPITRRFKNVDTLLPDDQSNRLSIYNKNSLPNLNFQPDDESFTTIELPKLKKLKKKTKLEHKQNYINEENKPTIMVGSKLKCPKVLHDYEPRLHSHQHASFLDVAQRFLSRQPEYIEKEYESHGRQKQHQQVKAMIENEHERIRLATLNFGQQIEERNIDNWLLDDSFTSY